MALKDGSKKLEAAVRTIVRRRVTGQGSAQERVREAFAEHLSSVRADEDLPEACRGEFQALWKRVTREQPRGVESALEATTAAMSDEEAWEVGREVLHLNRRVAEEGVKRMMARYDSQRG